MRRSSGREDHSPTSSRQHVCIIKWGVSYPNNLKEKHKVWRGYVQKFSSSFLCLQHRTISWYNCVTATTLAKYLAKSTIRLACITKQPTVTSALLYIYEVNKGRSIDLNVKVYLANNIYINISAQHFVCKKPILTMCFVTAFNSTNAHVLLDEMCMRPTRLLVKNRATPSLFVYYSM